ncbi:alkaline phosphatase family protein [Pustulibacterium marinum]|nr:ectonucleotide pyrophosphatase/phosphodiesterase [Pustulibacterium marinum]
MFNKKHLLTLAFLTFVTVNSQAQEEETYQASVDKEIKSSNLINSKENQEKPYVIMVSIDGFRYDYAEKHGAKNIQEMAKNGSHVTQLTPSFPSKTFPNHYSLVTGLYPEHHGIVSNSFYDKKQEATYSIGRREAVQDGSWYGGTPLWNLAQQQQMVSASYFWVGSEADINGMHPTYYYEYNKKRDYGYRVKRVAEWLQMPKAERPHIITLYFSIVDTQGHKFGPDAEETKSAVQKVDEQIGALREEIKKSGLPVYLIVTSDHGMDDVNQLINLHDYIEIDENEFFAGPVAMIYTKDESEKDKLYETLSQQTEFKTYKQENVPNYLNFKNNDKIGDLVLIAEAPKTIVYSQTEKTTKKKPGGMHGYDPFFNQNMGAIFYVEGPNIKKNYTQSAVENVNVYPFVAHLLGLEITLPIDGELSALESMLEE